MAKKTKKAEHRVMLKDKNALHSLWMCGHVSERDLQQVWGSARAKTYLDKGIIQSCGYSDEKGKRIFALTKDGEKFCKKDEGLRFNGTPQDHAKTKLRHNLSISKKYMSLDEEQRWTCRTEGDLKTEIRGLKKEMERDIAVSQRNFERASGSSRDEAEEELYRQKGRLEDLEYALTNKEISCPDLVYVDNGVEVCYEVVTQNYTETEISAKLNFAAFTERDIEIQRV